MVNHLRLFCAIHSKNVTLFISSNEVDEPRACYTEWNKSERERQILYINACIWNLERWYQWSYMQGNKGRHRCKEQTFGLSGRRWGWDDLRAYHWNMYITICKTDDQCKSSGWSRGPKASVLGQPRGIEWERRWDGCSGWGGHMYTYGRFMLMYGKTITIL